MSDDSPSMTLFKIQQILKREIMENGEIKEFTRMRERLVREALNLGLSEPVKPWMYKKILTDILDKELKELEEQKSPKVGI